MKKETVFVYRLFFVSCGYLDFPFHMLGLGM